jgi:hypothetical protein
VPRKFLDNPPLLNNPVLLDCQCTLFHPDIQRLEKFHLRNLERKRLGK